MRRGIPQRRPTGLDTEGGPGTDGELGKDTPSATPGSERCARAERSQIDSYSLNDEIQRLPWR